MYYTSYNEGTVYTVYVVKVLNNCRRHIHITYNDLNTCSGICSVSKLLLYLHNKETIRGLSLKAMPSNVLPGFSLPFTGRYSALSPTPARDSRKIVRQRVFIFLSFSHSWGVLLPHSKCRVGRKTIHQHCLKSPYSLVVIIGAETSSKNWAVKTKKRTLCFSVDFQEKRILSPHFLRQPLFTALPSLPLYFQMEIFACLNENLLVACHKIITHQIYICWTSETPVFSAV